MTNIYQPSLGQEELWRITEVFDSNWIGKGQLASDLEILVCGDGAMLLFKDLEVREMAEKWLYFGLETKSGQKIAWLRNGGNLT